MEITIKPCKEQQEMEERLKMIISIFPELSEKDQKQILDYLVFLYNN